MNDAERERIELDPVALIAAHAAHQKSLEECDDVWCQNEHLDEAIRGYLTAAMASPARAPLQARVDDWLVACFGEEIARDRIERNHRFIEEALELVQANGCTQSEAHQLVDYVYGRPVGELKQEVGGVMNTLAALCLASGVDMGECAETEMVRCWANIEKTRAKQKAKPKHSPLPEHAPQLAPDRGVVGPVAWQILLDGEPLNYFEDNDRTILLKRYTRRPLYLSAAPPARSSSDGERGQ